MSDRELLELAAKAAGVVVNMARQNERDTAGFGHVGLWTVTTTNWNPLTDDGDALRLAVALHMNVEVAEGKSVYACAQYGNCSERVSDDRLAATRRAIVRAAAEVGRRMP